MPLTKSAKKAYRAAERRRQRNLVREKKLSQVLKKARLAAKQAASAANLKEAVSAIDKATKTHLLTKNKANRLKSRLMKKTSQSETPPKAKTEKKPAKKEESARRKTKSRGSAKA